MDGLEGSLEGKQASGKGRGREGREKGSCVLTSPRSFPSGIRREDGDMMTGTTFALLSLSADANLRTRHEGGTTLLFGHLQILIQTQASPSAQSRLRCFLLVGQNSQAPPAPQFHPSVSSSVPLFHTARNKRGTEDKQQHLVPFTPSSSVQNKGPQDPSKTEHLHPKFPFLEIPNKFLSLLELVE
jgi:hypothetical protein